MVKRNTQHDYQKLAAKWLAGTITPDEEQIFRAWYDEHQDDPIEIPASVAKYEKEHHDRILRQIKAQINITKNRRRHFVRYAIAASLVLVLFSIGMYVSQKQPRKELRENANQTDVEPGGNKATLTLADGSTINLNVIKDGETLKEKGIEIVKEADGLIAYKAKPMESGEESIQFNTISTPKGGQYRVILPDGTKVWLNAASSLRYPTAFAGGERKVELTGEGYFEVVHDKKMPFKVATQKQEIIVYGTHFNVNAYMDEPITKTTLLEGSIGIHLKGKASENGSELMLKPGEQSVLSRTSEVRISHVDILKEVAWKNGIFSFQGSDIHSVMREISRWYNVDVVFEGELPNIKLWGEMDRTVTASEALEILGYFNLKYRILQVGKEKKIIIS